MKLFTAILHDAQLLGHFLAHYRRAGITDFYIALNRSFETALAEFLPLYPITAFSDLEVSDTVIGGVSAVTEMRRRYQQPEEWVTIVDLDEFIESSNGLTEIIHLAEVENANIVRAIMWDRFSIDGRVCGFKADVDLNNVYPIKARFIRNVMLGADFKGVLVKGHLESLAAHHTFKKEVVCSQALDISHYKWTDGAIERLRAAHQMVAAAGRPFAVEYARILDHYDRHGRFKWEEFGGEFVPSTQAPK